MLSIFQHHMHAMLFTKPWIRDLETGKEEKEEEEEKAEQEQEGRKTVWFWSMRVVHDNIQYPSSVTTAITFLFVDIHIFPWNFNDIPCLSRLQLQNTAVTADKAHVTNTWVLWPIQKWQVCRNTESDPKQLPVWKGINESSEWRGHVRSAARLADCDTVKFNDGTTVIYNVALDHAIMCLMEIFTSERNGERLRSHNS